jgi:hypothetical protein
MGVRSSESEFSWNRLLAAEGAKAPGKAAPTLGGWGWKQGRWKAFIGAPPESDLSPSVGMGVGLDCAAAGRQRAKSGDRRVPHWDVLNRGTAYGVYSGQNIAIQTLAAKILELDLVLTDYGPEAIAGRAQLRRELAKSIGQIWNGDSDKSQSAAHHFAAAIDTLRHKEAYRVSLNPSTDAQKQALATATKTIESIGQARL